MTDALRLPYRVAASSSAEAIEAAKVLCRGEGWTLRTVAGAREAGTPGQWIVTLVVRSKAGPA